MGREEKTIICPFYVAEPECASLSNCAKAAHEVLKRRRIRCEGLTPGGKLFIEFKTPSEKSDHKANFCASMCYKGCPVAQMLLENYDMRKKRITDKGRC